MQDLCLFELKVRKQDEKSLTFFYTTQQHQHVSRLSIQILSFIEMAQPVFQKWILLCNLLLCQGNREKKLWPSYQSQNFLRKCSFIQYRTFHYKLSSNHHHVLRWAFTQDTMFSNLLPNLNSTTLIHQPKKIIKPT